MSLFSPAWKTSNPKKIDKAIASIDGISSIDKLSQIALSAPLSEIKSAAVKRIIELSSEFDGSGLLHVMDTINIYDVHRAIINTTDDDLMLETFFLSKRCLCREEAISKIKDEEILKRLILLNDRDTISCIGRIHDDSFLKDIVDSNKNIKLRLEALRSIGDMDIIIDIASNSDDRDIAKEAISGIDDLQSIDRVISERTPKGPNLMRMTEKEILTYAYRQRDIILCRTHDSGELRYVSPATGKEVCYIEEYPYAEYALTGFFSDGKKEEYIKYTSKRRDEDVLCYPFAVVEVSKNDISNGIRICPECHKVRDNDDTLIGKCACGSDTNPVPMRYYPPSEY